MRRRQLVELEDLTWFPAWIRNYGTDYLRYVTSLVYPLAPIEAKLARVMRLTGTTEIVDLCSGGAGPLARLVRGLVRHDAMVEQVTMTDKYPNLDALAYVAGRSDGALSFSAEPVDATAVPPSLAGLRTLINGFHHFPPELARSILQDAVDRRRPIAVIEFVERRMALLLLLGGGLFSILLAPFVRPFSVKRLLAFWIVPVVPLLVMWDGFISCLRAYSPDELDALVAGLSGADGYRFEIGRASASPFLPRVTYLIGHATSGPEVAGSSA
jgi:hypothetical protein